VRSIAATGLTEQTSGACLQEEGTPWNRSASATISASTMVIEGQRHADVLFCRHIVIRNWQHRFLRVQAMVGPTLAAQLNCQISPQEAFRVSAM